MSTVALPYDLPSDPTLDEILADTRVGRLATQLVISLVRNWAWFKAECWPSNATIAEKLRIHPKSVPRALRELEAAGWAKRVPTDDPRVGSGRLIKLLWRVDGSDPVTPGVANALPKQGGGELVEKLRNVTQALPTEDKRPQEAPGTSQNVARTIRPPVARACPGAAVSPIPALIAALKDGATPEARAELVNRIAHRFNDKKPATYGFARKWVNAAADGVGGALDALAHGFAKADEAMLKKYPNPAMVFVRRVQDFFYRPPAASTVGAVQVHQAPPEMVAAYKAQEAAKKEQAAASQAHYGRPAPAGRHPLTEAEQAAKREASLAALKARGAKVPPATPPEVGRDGSEGA